MSRVVVVNCPFGGRPFVFLVNDELLGGKGSDDDRYTHQGISQRRRGRA
jgi:hypothetical protein